MFQFAATIILICGLIVISKQINFVKHKDLGFKTDKLIYLKLNVNPAAGKTKALADKLIQYHGIKSLTETIGIPGDIQMTMSGYETMVIDSTTLKTFGFEIIKGRNLHPSDIGAAMKDLYFFVPSKACLINEEVLKKFDNGEFKNHKIMGSKIVGVVADFNYSSLYSKIGPLVLMYGNGKDANYITMRISGSISKTINYIKKVWKEIYPDYQMDFGFYDDYFASMYKKEEDLASLISIFSVLAIIISCMGIFGMSVFQSEQRIKEIGIRKVLGASVLEIIFLLTKSFSKWVVFANVIAVPVAYYFLTKWLQDFAYKINISWWMFAAAGSIALLVALVTVSFQAIISATANPVKSLKYE